MKVFRKMGWVGAVILLICSILLGKCAYDEADADDAHALSLMMIPIEKEVRCSHYNKAKHYKHKRSVEKKIAAQYGGAYSPYDGVWHPSIKHTDIEHIVATSEAHDSGLCARSIEVRTEFANDLDNLTLATPSVNRAKGDLDPAEWMPEYNQCWYISQWWHVKFKYGLSMDEAEAAAVNEWIDYCQGNYDME